MLPSGRQQVLHSFIHSFIRSFIHSSYFYSASLSPPTTQRRFRHSTDTVPEFHVEAPQATVSKGLAQGSYVAARAGVEPMTLRTKCVDSIKAPPRPASVDSISAFMTSSTESFRSCCLDSSKDLGPIRPWSPIQFRYRLWLLQRKNNMRY